jgi:lipopolysaccharide/colanic/teichoic acid biosynthesis glycosyltransferase
MIRFFDFLFALFGLLIFSPFIFVIVLLIIMNSKGPVFYKQKRVGRNNIDFFLFKFRTMHLHADKLGLLTVGDRDTRVTKIGFFLRKNKLDELPQLINVIKGDMSLVGPRPEVRKYVDLYSDEQKKVLKVRPGITDLASIKYANENEILAKVAEPEKYYIEHIMPDKITINYWYIENNNIRSYFSIIFQTIAKIIAK